MGLNENSLFFLVLKHVSCDGAQQRTSDCSQGASSEFIATKSASGTAEECAS